MTTRDFVSEMIKALPASVLGRGKTRRLIKRHRTVYRATDKRLYITYGGGEVHENCLSRVIEAAIVEEEYPGMGIEEWRLK